MIEFPVRTFSVLSLLLLLTACSGDLVGDLEEKFPGRQVEYKSSISLPSLEVPPDLSSSAIGEQLVVPGDGSATFSEYSAGSQRTAAASNTVLPGLGSSNEENQIDQLPSFPTPTDRTILPQLTVMSLIRSAVPLTRTPSAASANTAAARSSRRLVVLAWAATTPT